MKTRPRFARLMVVASASTALLAFGGSAALGQDSEACYPIQPEGCDEEEPNQTPNKPKTTTTRSGAPSTTEVRSSELAATGIDIGVIALAAAGAAAAGAGSLAAARRRSGSDA